jgi:O-acetyl-ADP-ribose deacetylase (regulator of RNase III)
MIIYRKGDIFNSNAQVITNPVNCVGVMGKGLALEFKNRFPDMFSDYQKKCAEKEVRVDQPYLWENGKVQILNFATKKHWKDNSNLQDIKNGLLYLAKNYDEMGISSIALPPLGCGLGGLKWNDVKALIEETLGPIHDLDVFVYEPTLSNEKADDFSQTKAIKGKNHSGIAAASTNEQPSLF